MMIPLPPPKTPAKPGGPNDPDAGGVVPRAPVELHTPPL